MTPKYTYLKHERHLLGGNCVHHNMAVSSTENNEHSNVELPLRSRVGALSRWFTIPLAISLTIPLYYSPELPRPNLFWSDARCCDHPLAGLFNITLSS